VDTYKSQALSIPRALVAQTVLCNQSVRALERIQIERLGLLHFQGIRGVHPCMVKTSTLAVQASTHRPSISSRKAFA
jgi:hypothetical protein